MRIRMLVPAIALAVGAAAGGCATSEEWAEWRAHSSHFASGQHATFSMRNREGTAPRVARLMKLMKQWQARVGDTLELPAKNTPPRKDRSDRKATHARSVAAGLDREEVF